LSFVAAAVPAPADAEQASAGASPIANSPAHPHPTPPPVVPFTDTRTPSAIPLAVNALRHVPRNQQPLDARDHEVEPDPVRARHDDRPPRLPVWNNAVCETMYTPSDRANPPKNSPTTATDHAERRRDLERR